MASSDVAICNDALAMIGHDFIVSLETASKPAGLCKVFYPLRRDEVLRSHPWNFAMKRMELAAVTTAPVWGYDVAYALPSDCLRVWQLDLSHSTTRWKVEARTIVADQSAPLNILYIAQITDTALFDAQFSAALACRIAADLALPITSSAALRKAMLEEYETRIRAARGTDATEGLADVPYADMFIEARL